MSAKFVFVVFALAALVVLGSVFIGTAVLKDIKPVYVPSEQILTSFLLRTDGSWELKIKNDHSSNITLTNLFISVNDVKVNSSLSLAVPYRGIVTVSSNDSSKTSGGVAGFNYLAFISITYLVNNHTIVTTRRHNGFFLRT